MIKRILILILLILPIAICCVLSQYYTIAINQTESLSGTIFLVRKGILPNRQDQFVVFQAPETSRHQTNLIKLVGGMAQDHVTRQGLDYYINNRFIGSAKLHDKTGHPVKLSDTGIIPEGKYFVYTKHEDSYDSKYQEIGWIDQHSIIGVAYEIY